MLGAVILFPTAALLANANDADAAANAVQASSTPPNSGENSATTELPFYITSKTTLHAPDGTGDDRLTVGIGEQIVLKVNGKDRDLEPEDEITWEIISPNDDPKYATLIGMQGKKKEILLKIEMPNKQQTPFQEVLFKKEDGSEEYKVIPVPTANNYVRYIFDEKKVIVKVTSQGKSTQIIFTIYTPHTRNMVGKIPEDPPTKGIWAPISKDPAYGIGAKIFWFPEPLFVNFGGGPVWVWEIPRKGGALLPDGADGAVPYPQIHRTVMFFDNIGTTGRLTCTDEIGVWRLPHQDEEEKSMFVCGFAWNHKNFILSLTGWKSDPKWIGEMNNANQTILAKNMRNETENPTIVIRKSRKLASLLRPQ